VHAEGFRAGGFRAKSGEVVEILFAVISIVAGDYGAGGLLRQANSSLANYISKKAGFALPGTHAV
jgi:hypothetical protein